MSTTRTKRDGTAAITYETLVEQSADQHSLDSLPPDGTATLDEPTTEESNEPLLPERVADRYVRRELLGKGGMGEVWRVYDERLNRSVACKVLLSVQSERTLSRFEEEARVTAQLQHPGILPVHDLGQLEDGRLWFTMKEVRGRTLSELIDDVHRDWRLGRAGEWTFRRLLEGFRRVCETVAYAHARGVVHRDIKPSNVMFGGYGEISVLDWGIARVLGQGSAEDPIEATLGGRSTRVGVISGTPNYMSPEQAQGRSAEAGMPADVYSLGATLYDLLADRPPRVVKGVRKLIFQVALGQPPLKAPSAFETGAPTDEALDDLVLRALSLEEEDRPTAAELASELGDWLDGAKKRERARELVAEAEQQLRLRGDHLTQATELRVSSEAALEGVARNAPVAEKVEGWRLADEAAALERSAQDARTEAILGLRSALSHAADLPEAHAMLARIFAERHGELEQAKRHDEARATALDVRQHDHDGHYTAYLKGTGALTLHTDVPAEVKLHRFVLQNRRLEPVFERDLGRTPLLGRPLPMGSYLLTLHAPGRAVVRYPVWIRRQEHWHGIAPDETHPTVIRLPREEELAHDDIYVPAAWCWVGDDFFEHTLPLQRVWTDAFVIKKYPVTIGEYVEYLNDLIEQGREAEALEMQPTVSSHDSVAFYERDTDGWFLGMRADLPGIEHWKPRLDLPATMLTYGQADAYAAWRTAHDGSSWRLPWEWERQHAIRGADQRSYPWGDVLDPTWCQMLYTADRSMLVPVHKQTLDCSPYGVFGGAGNVSEYLLDTEEQRFEGLRLPADVCTVGRRFAGGGNCGSGPKTCMNAQRDRSTKNARFSIRGFRLVRSELSSF